jgi:hypothetical protein
MASLKALFLQFYTIKQFNILLVAMKLFANKGGRHNLKENLAWEEIMIQFRNIKSQANNSKFLEIQ